ncbi:MAG: 5-bromo-4-chloroindolyl phosphate hydrolysis family protein [Oscillospiraceae bacterium]|nr:5-bromo-4-chloroindolyl phosphate hydrolysis family protein [Oscillospiraceae bacterium]MCL2278687.1 5-bromo-4-chloroindolyl phosphate hydrolysis family protein [Oscillospiraceae bacterium]
MENIDKKANKATAIGVLQYITGALIFIICMILALVTSLLMIDGSIVPTVLMVSGIAVGTLLTCRGVINYKRASRYRRIKKAMGNAKSMELTELQSKLGWPKDKIIGFIKNQKNHGYWPESHLDTEKGMFMLGYNPSHLAADTGNTATDELLKEANAHLHDMATATRSIEDETLRERAGRIIDTTKQIYKAVEQNPDKQSAVRQLSNYFLPTTSKLLADYVELQSKPIKSDNMQESMLKIKDAMTTIEESFKKQQEAIYNDKAMDISVEIDVLKKMMS